MMKKTTQNNFFKEYYKLECMSKVKKFNFYLKKKLT
jgi:hypothetical protein